MSKFVVMLLFKARVEKLTLRYISRKNAVRGVFQILVLIASIAASSFAQLTTGYISGTVQDTSGAVIEGVRISVREQATGIRRETVANEAGVYRFVGLEPGTYTVEFFKAGFEIDNVTGIELTSAKEVVLNRMLVVGGAPESITVHSALAGVQLSKASPTIERRFDREVLESTPLAGSREVTALARLAPTVLAAGTANGQTAWSNNFLFDGMENKDTQQEFRIVRATPELAGEVHVQTNAYSAEFGRNTGAHISVASRGGTNQLHGQLWDYYGADWMPAETLANKRAGLLTSRFADHDLGANLGGPIKQNRTFFFGYFRSVLHREGLNANGQLDVTIPTPAGFAALSSVPLGSGQTPEGRAAVRRAIDFLPEIHAQIKRWNETKTIPVNQIPIEFGAARVPIARPTDLFYYFGRVDHQLTAKDSLSVRAYVEHFPPAIGDGGNQSFGKRFASNLRFRNQSYALSNTHVFGPAVVNEVRISFIHSTTQHPPFDAGMRTLVENLFTFGPSEFDPFMRTNIYYQAQNVLTWTRGRHSVKFGADLIQIRDVLSGRKQSFFNFTNFADFFNNNASRATFPLGSGSAALLFLRQSYFAQDDFKLSPTLTLNLGVRYQFTGIPAGLWGAASPEIAAAGVPLQAQPDPNDWAPRVGFAYSPSSKSGWRRSFFGDGRTVFRGGFGISYATAFEQANNRYEAVFAGNYPYSATVVLEPPATLNLYPRRPVDLPGLEAFNPLANTTNYDTHPKNPTTHFYSFSVQRQLGENHVVEVGYSGNHSYHVLRQTDRNWSVLTEEQAARVIATGDQNSIPKAQLRRLNPSWGGRVFLETTDSHSYNAGYVKFDRRMARGLLLGANYTWSASLGYGSGGLFRPVDPNNHARDYSRTGMDRPHRIALHYVWIMPGRHILGGLRFSGMSQWQSGPPFSVTTGVDSNGDGWQGGLAGHDRPNYNPGGHIQLDPVTGNWRTFTTPLDGSGLFLTPLRADGTPLPYSMPFGGNLGRNTFRGPGLSLWDLSLMKPFRLNERWQLDVRADWINLFNHRNFGPPAANMSNSVLFGTNSSDPGSRQMLLGLKLRF
jgi:Carboxypeptidase regulatory-like domain